MNEKKKYLKFIVYRSIVYEVKKTIEKDKVILEIIQYNTPFNWRK